MLQAEETCFELGRREVDTALKAKMEKFPESGQIRLHRVRKAPHRLFCEEKTKHRADAIKLVSSAESTAELSLTPLSIC